MRTNSLKLPSHFHDHAVEFGYPSHTHCTCTPPRIYPTHTHHTYIRHHTYIHIHTHSPPHHISLSHIHTHTHTHTHTHMHTCQHVALTTVDSVYFHSHDSPLCFHNLPPASTNSIPLHELRKKLLIHANNLVI